MVDTHYGRDVKVYAALQDDADTIAGSSLTAKWLLLDVLSVDRADHGAEFTQDRRLGKGRSPQAHAGGLESPGLSVTVPIDPNQFGFWARMAMGAPSTTGSGPYTHTFRMSDSPAREYFTIAIEYATTGVTKKVDKYRGCVVNSIGFTFGNDSSLMTATLEILALERTRAGSVTLDSSPVTTNSSGMFLGWRGRATLDLEASPRDGILSSSVTVSNNMSHDHGPNASDPQAAGYLIGNATASGSITARFLESLLYDLEATDANLLHMSLGARGPSSHSVGVIINKALVSPTGQPVGDDESPIDVTYNFEASDDGTNNDIRIVVNNAEADHDFPALS